MAQTNRVNKEESVHHPLFTKHNISEYIRKENKIVTLHLDKMLLDKDNLATLPSAPTALGMLQAADFVLIEPEQRVGLSAKCSGIHLWKGQGMPNSFLDFSAKSSTHTWMMVEFSQNSMKFRLIGPKCFRVTSSGTSFAYFARCGTKGVYTSYCYYCFPIYVVNWTVKIKHIGWIVS
jgi:hypothetical protein